jgi:ankyrin repeat protein
VIGDTEKSLTEPERDFLSAVIYGFDDRIKEFLEDGMSVEAPSKLGALALFKAVQFHRFNAIKTLLDHGVEVDAHHPDLNNPQTPLMMALRGKSVELVELLLSRGADIHLIDKAETSVLMNAVSVESAVDHFVPMLLERGADPKYTNSIGSSALFNAALFGYTNAVRMLLEYGADPNVKCQDQSPLDVALANGHTETAAVIRQFIGTTSSLSASQLGDALINAARAYEDKSHALVSQLIADGANPNFIGEKCLTPLAIAATCGNVRTMQILINAGADVNLPGIDNATPLHQACSTGRVEAVKLLLLYNADPNANDRNNQSPLIRAISSRNPQNVEIVSALLESGARADVLTTDGKSALQLAADRGLPAIASMLAKEAGEGEEPNRSVFRSQLLAAVDSKDNEKLGALLDQDIPIPKELLVEVAVRALGRRQGSTLEILLLYGLDPNARNDKGTPLVFGIVADRIDPGCLATFMESGFDVTMTDEAGSNILHLLAAARTYSYGLFHWADRPVSYGEQDVEICMSLARQAVAAGADASQMNRDGATPLMLAAESATPELVELFLQQSATVNEQDKRGMTALMYGARGGEKQLGQVAILLEGGADPQLQDKDGKDALAYASASGATQIVQLLLKQNSSAGQPSQAIIEAAESGNVEMVKLLVSQGANVNGRDKEGRTALYCASLNGHPEVVRILLKNGADPNISDDQHKAPLHCVGWCGNLEIARLLIKAGADLNAGNAYGMTPTFFASTGFWPELLHLLKQSGAELKRPGDDNYTALMAACRAAQHHVAADRIRATFEILIDEGIEVNAVDSYGRSALEYLAGAQNYSSGSEETTGMLAAGAVLIARGADCNHSSKDGTPLEHAERLGFATLASMIREVIEK